MNNILESSQKNGISLTLLDNLYNIDNNLKLLLGINLTNATNEIKKTLSMELFNDLENQNITLDNIQDLLFEFMSRYSNNIFNDLKKQNLLESLSLEDLDAIKHFNEVVSSIIYSNKDFLEDLISLTDNNQNFER